MSPPVIFLIFSSFFDLEAHNLRSYSLRKLEKMLSSGFTLTGPNAISQYPCNMAKLWSYRSFMRKEFTFSKAIQDTAKERLQEAISAWRAKNINNTKVEMRRTVDGRVRKITEPLVVGVHVRRTDYMMFFEKRTGGSVPGTSYFEKAFDYYRKK